MFESIRQAFVSAFGLGRSDADTDTSPPSVQYPPGFQHLLDRAAQLKNAAPPKPMGWGEATNVLARLAGQRPASEAPPPAWRVKLAREALPEVVLQYLHVLEVLGRSFPRAGKSEAEFKRSLENLVRTDVHTWLAGLFSGKVVTLPPHITEVLIQRAANAMGHRQPQVRRMGPVPAFYADAETQVHVVDIKTGFYVFPRAIIRGDAELVEIPGTAKFFHWDSAMLSGWDFWLGYAGPVFDPPVIPDAGDAADDAVEDLNPNDNPNPN